jgi:hypothetical protein
VTNVTRVQHATGTGVQRRIVQWSSWRMIQESSDECYSGPAGEWYRSPVKNFKMVQLVNNTEV